MIKHGKVVMGSTPSAVSGKPATCVVKGEPLRRREQLSGMEQMVKSAGFLVDKDLKGKK